MLCVDVEADWEDDVAGREKGVVHGGNSGGPAVNGVVANNGGLGNETIKTGRTHVSTVVELGRDKWTCKDLYGKTDSTNFTWWETNILEVDRSKHK